MLMMNVGVVRVIVCNPHVCVPMRVRLVPIPRKFVRMLMVLIMYMAVRMGYGVVRMHVFMTFGQVQPHTDSHHKCRSPEGPGSGFTKGHYRDPRTDKGNR